MLEDYGILEYLESGGFEAASEQLPLQLTLMKAHLRSIRALLQHQLLGFALLT